MLLGSIFKKLTEALSAITDVNDARREAELILIKVLNIPRTTLYVYPEKNVSDEKLQLINAWQARRLHGEPLAYILRSQAFMDLELAVTPATLIPRVETESLVAWILANFHCEQPLSIADLGTGTGAIAIALARTCKAWEIIATDQSHDALLVAKHNSVTYQTGNIHFVQSDWFACLPKQQFDLMVSNPPYVAVDDPHLADLCYEPQSALVAGKDGLDAIRIIVREASKYLNINGVLMIEHGFDQGEKVRDLMQQADFKQIKTEQDLNYQDRFTIARM